VLFVAAKSWKSVASGSRKSVALLLFSTLPLELFMFFQHVKKSSASSGRRRYPELVFRMGAVHSSDCLFPPEIHACAAEYLYLTFQTRFCARMPRLHRSTKSTDQYTGATNVISSGLH